MVLAGQLDRRHFVKAITLIAVSTLRIILQLRANVAKRIKMQYKLTLENTNKYHEYNTRVSHIKSLITEYFFNVFTKWVSLTRKQCCLDKPIEYIFAFNDGNVFPGKVPTAIWLIM